MKKWLAMMIALMLATAPMAMAEDMAQTDALLSMLPVFDSILRTVREDASSYDPQNAEFVWGVLYRMGVNFGLDYPDVSIDEETFDVVVTGSLMRDFAAAAFPGLAKLPAPSTSVTYDEASDAYRLPGSDMGESETVVEGSQDVDGKLAVAVAMMDLDGSKLDGMTITVSKAQDGALFPYVVDGAE